MIPAQSDRSLPRRGKSTTATSLVFSTWDSSRSWPQSKRNGEPDCVPPEPVRHLLQLNQPALWRLPRSFSSNTAPCSAGRAPISLGAAIYCSRTTSKPPGYARRNHKNKKYRVLLAHILSYARVQRPFVSR